MRELLLALRNSLRGIAFAARTERAVRQELVLLALGVPVAMCLGATLWIRVALLASLLLMLAAEFLNTAIEALCDRLHPGRDAGIGIVKDLGSAGVFCTQLLALLVWIAAGLDRLA